MRTTRVQSAQDAQRAREKAEGKSSSGGRGAGAEDEEEKGGEEEEEDGGDDDDDDEAGDPLRASTALLALGGASGDEEG